MSRSGLEMTTTSYAVLGLLCVQPWSAYELTRQMERSLRFVWPRAQSGIYREPQRLVDLGYATVRDAPAGPRRTKRIYAATPAGRRVLRRWLATPSAPPQFESEALLKFFFADQGTVDDARRALGELSAHAEELLTVFRAASADYARDQGPFPNRLHIGSAFGRFVYHYAQAMNAWAHWCAEHVNSWPDTGPAALPIGQAIQAENARLATLANAAPTCGGTPTRRASRQRRQ